MSKEYKESAAIRERENQIKTNVLKIPHIIDHNSLWEFEETDLMPTYTFAVCAGPFAMHENFLHDKSEKIPEMNIYCRSSVNKDIDVFSIFRTAKNVLLWFKENLTSTIPTQKLDLVFLPNLKPCAMENHGCITFNDNFLDNTHTVNFHTYFNSIIAHQIALTWFGNWVTPEWWDDLWLNESLATFLSYLCLKQLAESKSDEMGQFNNAWLLFNKYKAKAIIYDQYKTTHKITEPIEDISKSEIALDKITYYKGAAVLKYFYYVCGHELFFKALRNYVERYQNKNANYEQFKEIIRGLILSREIDSPIAVLEPFLDNIGVTRLETEIKAVNNRIEQFKIYQNICQHATPGKYYNHRMNALLIFNDGTEKLFNEIAIKDTYETRVEKLENIEKPAAIVLNSGDWAYFKQTFDHASKEYLIENTFRIKDPVTRLVVARDLSQMIQDGLFDVEGYIDFTTNLLKHEKETHIVEQVLRTAIHLATHFVIFDKQNNIKQRIFNLIETELFHKHRFIKKTLVNYMIDLVDFSHTTQIKLLINLLSDTKASTNFERGQSEILDNFNLIDSIDCSYLDIKTKFRLLETIEESRFLLDHEKKNLEEKITAGFSSSNVSRNSSFISIVKIEENDQRVKIKGEILENMTLQACSPRQDSKENLWNLLVDKSRSDYTDEQYIALMKGFARKSQYPILKEYFEERFFENFPEVLNYQGEKYAVLFFKYLAPSFVIREDILRKFIQLGRCIRYNDHKLKKLYEKSNYYFINYILKLFRN